MKRQLWFWVLVAIAAGIVFGLVAPGPATDSKWLADAFLQLIKTVTAPVIFVTVVIGIASLGDMARAGGLALRALGYFLIATATALTLGLIAGNLIKPGAGFDASRRAAGAEAAKEKIAEAAGSGSGFTGFITDDLLPTSFVQPFVENEILRVLIIAILVAAGISVLARREREQVIAVFEVDLEDPVRDHPHDHVGGAAGRVRRHGLHGRAVRRRRAVEPRAADGHLLGHLRGVRVRRARPGRALERLQHLQVRAAAEGRAADHRRHVVVGDRAAAAAGQAAARRARRSRPSASCCRRATRSTSTAPAST